MRTTRQALPLSSVLLPKRSLHASKSIDFKGRVAIITGAGGALGQAYALDLAKRGCHLLLNDLGASLTGENTGETQSNVFKLAEHINSLGTSKAVVNTDSVLEGEKIVQQAVQTFGQVDVLVSNAGNLRDKSFHKMADEDWLKVIEVHLQGTFSMTHALWPVLQQQQYGRIVTIGSGAGLYGNFGQANYSSAKMGILGLTQTLAKEGSKYNIQVNCVVPVAASRMTETVLTADLLKELQPAYVAPIVTYLASEGCQVTGGCYEVGGGWYSKVRLQRSKGMSLSPSAESIATNLEGISHFDDEATYPTSPADAFQAIMKARKTASTSSASSSPRATASTASSSHTASQSQELKADQTMRRLQGVLLKHPTLATEAAKIVKARVCVVVMEPQTKEVLSQWLLDLRPDSPVQIIESKSQDVSEKAKVTLKGSDSTISELFEGVKSAEMAYMTGALQIEGSMGTALKIKDLLPLLQEKVHS